jgi:hypothetical protein
MRECFRKPKTATKQGIKAVQPSKWAQLERPERGHGFDSHLPREITVSDYCPKYLYIFNKWWKLLK